MCLHCKGKLGDNFINERVIVEKQIDKVDLEILELLRANGRYSFAEIGRRVHLSVPAVAARVRRMEQVGIIEGYHAKINFEQLGLPILVFIQVWVPVEKYPPFKRLVSNMQGVVEWHHVTGDASYILKILLPSVAHLEAIVSELSDYGQTRSSIVMSSGDGKTASLLKIMAAELHRT